MTVKKLTAHKDVIRESGQGNEGQVTEGGGAGEEREGGAHSLYLERYLTLGDSWFEP